MVFRVLASHHVQKLDCVISMARVEKTPASHTAIRALWWAHQGLKRVTSSKSIGNFKKGGIGKGVFGNKLSEVCSEICDSFAHRFVVHEMDHQQFCVNLARDLHQICATPLVNFEF